MAVHNMYNIADAAVVSVSVFQSNTRGTAPATSSRRPLPTKMEVCHAAWFRIRHGNHIQKSACTRLSSEYEDSATSTSFYPVQVRDVGKMLDQKFACVCLFCNELDGCLTVRDMYNKIGLASITGTVSRYDQVLACVGIHSWPPSRWLLLQ